jgi:hypothetical protein
VKRVGRELGVRYVLEGSVRKGGARIRVAAQLIEAETGIHDWAEHYDRDLTDFSTCLCAGACPGTGLKTTPTWSRACARPGGRADSARLSPAKFV